MPERTRSTAVRAASTSFGVVKATTATSSIPTTSSSNMRARAMTSSMPGATFALGAGVEIEVLGTVDNFATTAINLTGNELSNYVTGNAGANTINGGAGSDYLEGRGGADSFAFTTTLAPGNVDQIADFSPGPTGSLSTMRSSPGSARRAASTPAPSSPGRPRTIRRPDHLQPGDRPALLRCRRQRQRCGGAVRGHHRQPGPDGQ